MNIFEKPIKIFEKPIDGCVFIHPDTKNLSDDKQLFVVGETLPRIKDFKGLSKDGFDKFGNYSFGIK